MPAWNSPYAKAHPDDDKEKEFLEPVVEEQYEEPLWCAACATHYMLNIPCRCTQEHTL